MGVNLPNSRGHTEAWESVSRTRGATPKRGDAYPQLQGHTEALVSVSQLKGPHRNVCTLCELPLRELLNERANMRTQNNYFVRKRPFSMGWNGGYGFKNSKKIKHRSLREKTTPFPYTAWPL